MEYISLTSKQSIETLEIVFDHPEYGSEYHTVVMIVDCDTIINWIEIAKDIWEKFNRHNIFFDMKITAYYTINGMKKSEYPDLIPSDNPTWEKVVYDGGNPNYI